MDHIYYTDKYRNLQNIKIKCNLKRVNSLTELLKTHLDIDIEEPIKGGKTFLFADSKIPYTEDLLRSGVEITNVFIKDLNKKKVYLYFNSIAVDYKVDLSRKDYYFLTSFCDFDICSRDHRDFVFNNSTFEIILNTFVTTCINEFDRINSPILNYEHQTFHLFRKIGLNNERDVDRQYAFAVIYKKTEDIDALFYLGNEIFDRYMKDKFSEVISFNQWYINDNK